MALYGQNLGKTIRQGTTWGQADDVLSVVGQALLDSYHSLSLWENWKANGTLDTINIAILSVISPSDHDQAKALLDSCYADVLSIRTMVQEQLAQEGESAAMPDDWVSKVSAIVSTSSDSAALVDKLFHTSVAEQAADQIVPAVGGIADQIANALSKFTGNLLAGLWWLWVPPLVLLVISPKLRHSVAKAVF